MHHVSMIILGSLLFRYEFPQLCDSPAKFNDGRDTPGSDASPINHERVENLAKGRVNRQQVKQ